MTPTIAIANLEPGDDNFAGLSDLTGLGHVDFEIEPHCDEQRHAAVQQYSKENGVVIYAIDDLTALKVVDGDVEVVSKGMWRLYKNGEII